MIARELLTLEQLGFYRDSGYLILQNQVPMEVIESIRDDIARFELEAKGMIESNDRLDLDDTHTSQHPRIRRIKLPHTTAETVNRLMRSDSILAPVRDLIGPNIRLHTTKLNMKSAGYGAAIEWHQDFAFYPHTNDDVLAVGVLIDDMTSENGPLMVFPGSHKGPIHDHHYDGVFVGAMNLAECGFDSSKATPLCAPAGSITLHHARTVHGSAANTSKADRRLLFIEVMAADAFPIVGAMTRFEGIEDYNSRMLCGKPTLNPRLKDVPVKIPQPQPDKNRSIYEVQSGLKHRAF